MSDLNFNVITQSVDIDGTEMSFETGRLAKQAGGSVLVTMGETVVLVVATAAKKARDHIDFLPLTCDYVEKSYAAGKIPGNYFRREGRQNQFEVLSSRIMDRPIRPLFPAGFRCEIQVIATVLSHDKVHESQICAMNGASAALSISDIPFNGPTACVRVARIDGELTASPTLADLEKADLNLLVACSPTGICMVEGSADFLPEDVILDALYYAQEACQPIIKSIEELREKCGKPKREVTPPSVDEELRGRVRELAKGPLNAALSVNEKMERYAQLDVAKDGVLAALADDESLNDRRGEIKGYIGEMKKDIVRSWVLDEGRRIGGRTPEQVRTIKCETGILPRTHGSAVFTRGETQVLSLLTLGTRKDSQRIETLTGDVELEFVLHYNFPAYSVGETKFLRGPGRREIGHGSLAQHGLAPVIPDQDTFPYTTRIVSEVLESNGSSSMATVCSGSMALMDAGVPISSPVAGIAMGLIWEGADRYAVLSDILGDEDHLGDMDFKVVGNYEGISALQMDIKINGLSREALAKALIQAKDGRVHILDCMEECISEPNLDLSNHAPRIFTVVINPEKIRDLIGPGGKHIRGIVDQTGAQIDVTDDGKVNIAAVDGETAQRAVDLVRSYTEEPESGKTYLGVVARVTDFGAFVTILPGTDGLVHISELALERVNTVNDICTEGDEILVKVINVDRQGKIRLSRKEVIIDQKRAAGEEIPEELLRRPEREERPRRDDRGGGGGRSRDGGGRGRDGGGRGRR